MKKIFTLVFFGAALASQAAPRHNSDSAQLKEKMEQVEKLVKQLQSEVRLLKTKDSTLTAELSSLRATLPAARQKQLVIDRRGSKQAYFQ